MPQYMTHANLRLTARGLFATGGAGSGRAPVEVADFASLILLEAPSSTTPIPSWRLTGSALEHVRGGR